MTERLEPPRRKDPQRVTRPAQIPPRQRSRASLGLTAVAARGVFALQVCAECREVSYPPRDACPACLGVDLAFQRVPDGGAVIAQTTVRATTDLYFRERTPWRVGIARLDCGPSVIAHLHGEVVVPSRVRMTLKLDTSGNAVMVALPMTESATMADDPQWRELTASPRDRRVLITDGRSPVGQAVVVALAKAGAGAISVGIAQPWKPFAGRERLEAMANVHLVPLDLSDSGSVEELAAEFGAKIEILVNTADHVRPGGVLTSPDVVTARETFETNVFGLQRLARAFGPVMRARGSDGTHPAVAFVDILPVHALAPMLGYGLYGASAAARLSLLQTLRSEMREGGIRVMAIFTGPVEDEWRQAVPPPKVQPAQLGKAVVTALEEGLEESFVGDVARDVADRYRDDPKVLERELGA